MAQPKVFRIYKIFCPIDNDSLVYYGATQQTIQKRFMGHKTGYKRWMSGKNKGKTTSYLLFERYGMDNCAIVEIENPATFQIMEQRESFYINTFACVNIMQVNRTPEEIQLSANLKIARNNYWKTEEYKKLKKIANAKRNVNHYVA